jgi:hypothetical protein
MGAASAGSCSASPGQSPYTGEFVYSRNRTRHLSAGRLPSSGRPRRNGNLSRRAKISPIRNAEENAAPRVRQIALLPEIAALDLPYGILSSVILRCADGVPISSFLHRG